MKKYAQPIIVLCVLIIASVLVMTKWLLFGAACLLVIGALALEIVERKSKGWYADRWLLRLAGGMVGMAIVLTIVEFM